MNVTLGGGGFILVGEQGGTVPNLFWLRLGFGSCVGLLSRSPLERDWLMRVFGGCFVGGGMS